MYPPATTGVALVRSPSVCPTQSGAHGVASHDVGYPINLPSVVGWYTRPPSTSGDAHAVDVGASRGPACAVQTASHRSPAHAIGNAERVPSAART
jgi:hypothetical protein